jgi:hypothetical protein
MLNVKECCLNRRCLDKTVGGRVYLSILVVLFHFRDSLISMSNHVDQEVSFVL